MKTIEERIAALERSNRRLRVLLAAAGFIIAAIFMTGAADTPVDDVIRVRHMLIVDGTNRPVTRLGAEKNGSVPSRSRTRITFKP